jgi:hypothetical protein
MNSFAPSGVLTAILPCNDLDTSERFYHRLGFTRFEGQWPPPQTLVRIGWPTRLRRPSPGGSSA